jgi:hypothetical protein
MSRRWRLGFAAKLFMKNFYIFLYKKNEYFRRFLVGKKVHILFTIFSHLSIDKIR